MSENSQNSGQKHGGKPFAKGDPRINRGGRPKGYNAFRKGFRNRARDDEMREELINLAKTATKEADRINAMRLYWEYGYGKTPAAPEDNDAVRSTRPLAGVSWDEIKAALKGESK